jgi:lipopolysaccharide/colanic/teichoic acid biosynthesis glycosyltransferase
LGDCFNFSMAVSYNYLMIKMDSPGPVFLGNDVLVGIIKTSWCVKFRTMQVNKLSDSMQAIKW